MSDPPPPPPPPIQDTSRPPGAAERLATASALLHRAYAALYERWLRMKQRLIPTEQQRLFGLTIAIGGSCGLAAVGFHLAIKLVAERTIERALVAPGFTFIGWTLLVPTLGGLLAGILLHRFVPEARGSGIPQVKVAYTLRGGRLRLRDSVGKFFVGALQIGTGSSLGREGPTVQICAGLAASLGTFAGVSQHNVRRLLPVGVAAGIAAAFNAPIAAVTFTIEEIVGTLDQTLLSGVIVAAALAAVVERSVLGAHPVFQLAATPGLDDARSLALYAVLGVAAALLSVFFSEALLRTRGWFKRLASLPPWAKPAVGGLATGLLALVALSTLQVGGITGGGYSVLEVALSGKLVVKVLLGLCALKLFATVLSYGSGGAGGIFAPSLFLGGMLGGAFGYLDIALFDHPVHSVGAFALVGMGAVFAGVVRAPITSVLIIVEMTSGYSLILPLMIANMSAYMLARRFRPATIYEALLEQDGIQLRQPKVLDALDGVRVEQFPLEERDFVSFPVSLDSGALLGRSARAGRQEVFPVLDAGERLVGLITLSDLAALAAEPQEEGLVRAIDLMRPALVARLRDEVRTAFELMSSSGLRELPVVDEERRVLGFLDASSIARAYLRAREQADVSPGLAASPP